MSVTGSIMAAAGLAGAGVSAFGASKAAGAQEDAANNAANVSRENALDALNFQKQQYNNSLQMLNPYLQTGYGALGLLRTGLGIGGPMPQGFTLPSGNVNSATPNLQAIRDQLRGNDGAEPRPLQAQAMGGMVPATVAPTQLGPGQGLGNDASGGPRMVPIAGEGGAPGGTIQANNGTLQVPFQGGGSTNGTSNIGFGSLLESYPGGPFVAPTGVTEQNDPGYQFRLKTGLDALNNSAAARGGLLSGGTAKALTDFAQNDASNEYGNVYSRALSTYGTNYNTFTNDQTNQFNKLAAISGLGQTSANQLSTAGLNTGNQVGNTLLNESNQVGGDLLAAGNARGSGFQNIGNSIGNGISSLSNLALLSQFLNQGGGTSTGGFV